MNPSNGYAGRVRYPKGEAVLEKFFHRFYRFVQYSHSGGNVSMFRMFRAPCDILIPGGPGDPVPAPATGYKIKSEKKVIFFF